MTTKQSKTESLEKKPLNFTWKEEHMSITGKDCKKKKNTGKFSVSRNEKCHALSQHEKPSVIL